MKTAEFHAPASLKTAIALLSELRGRATLVAGGTDVVVDINRRRLAPEAIVSLAELEELDFISEGNDGIHIGALSTHFSIATSPLVRQSIPILARASGTVGGPTIRNIATVGGNLVTASPGADSAVALLALDASITLANATRQRTLPLIDFFTGPGQTVRQSDEILTEIIVPYPEAGTTSDFQRQGRRKADCLGVAIAAVTLRCDSGTCEKARIALGAVGPRPFRSPAAEACLRDQVLDNRILQQAGSLAAGEAQPRDSGRGAAWYKRRLAGVLVERALANAAGLDLAEQ